MKTLTLFFLIFSGLAFGNECTQNSDCAPGCLTAVPEVMCRFHGCWVKCHPAKKLKLRMGEDDKNCPDRGRSFSCVCDKGLCGEAEPKK